MDLAERLKAQEGATGIPVIVVEGSPASGYAAALQGPFAHAFSTAAP
jgi:hypothetical protein